MKQFGALQNHASEHFYCLAGNHDATFAHEETQWWFRKWNDPTGENTKFSGVDAKKRPYPVMGTCGRYSFRVCRSATPMSRLFTFTEGSKRARVQCYLHTARFRPQGWYDEAERTLELSKPFQMA